MKRCPECHGTGESFVWVEINRTEESVTCEKRPSICPTCNGSGMVQDDNIDRILTGDANDLAEYGVHMCIPAGCYTPAWYGHFKGCANSKEEAIRKEIEWLHQPADRDWR